MRAYLSRERAPGRDEVQRWTTISANVTSTMLMEEAQTHPSDPERQRRRLVPGEPGVWLFVLGDMIVFGVFFAVFLSARADQPGLFEASRETATIAFGAVNTLLLLTGSWFVALGVDAIHHGRPLLASKLFAGTFVTGAIFGIDKVVEWSSKVADGHGPGANDYFMYFFAFTGVHFAHLLIGMVAMALMARAAGRPGLTRRNVRNIESGATYWHLVDLLWIVLFALLYLV
jgi:nitric oxide reductase NorE protein